MIVSPTAGGGRCAPRCGRPGAPRPGRQTGYGAGYRLYEAGDGGWVALVVPDAEGWARLRALPGAGALPAAYAPLRHGAGDADAAVAEGVLEAVFATAGADEG